MVKIGYRILCLLNIIVVGYAFSMDLTRRPKIRNSGQIITLPKIGEAGGEVSKNGYGPYPSKSSFCRHIGDEKWEINNVCFCAINRQDEQGNTFLHYAIMQGDGDLIQNLRGKGASLDIPNAEGKTPFNILFGPSYLHKNKAPMNSWILTYNVKSAMNQEAYSSYSFHSLVTAEKLDNKVLLNINELKKNYVGINWQDSSEGCTALHRLVMRPDATIEQVKVLLKLGADPEIRTHARKNDWGNVVLGDNVYKNGIKDGYQSSIEGVTEKNKYYGNKDVMGSIFRVILSRRLTKAMLEEVQKCGIHKQEEGFSFSRPELVQTKWEIATEDEARNLLRSMK